MNYKVGGIVWSDQGTTTPCGQKESLPFLVTHVDYNGIHFMNLSSGAIFDIDRHKLNSLMEHNDIHYEDPP